MLHRPVQEATPWGSRFELRGKGRLGFAFSFLMMAMYHTTVATGLGLAWSQHASNLVNTWFFCLGHPLRYALMIRLAVEPALAPVLRRLLGET